MQPVVARKDCLLVGHMDCLHFHHTGCLVARKGWFGHIRHLHRRCSRIAVLGIAVSFAFEWEQMYNLLWRELERTLLLELDRAQHCSSVGVLLTAISEM